MEGDAWISVAMAGGSLGALLLAVLRGAPQEVGNRLADSTQLQVVVSNTTRELNMIEEYVYKTIEAKENEPEAWKPAVQEGVKQMEELTAQALSLIQLYVEPQGESAKPARQLGINEGESGGAGPAEGPDDGEELGDVDGVDRPGAVTPTS